MKRLLYVSAARGEATEADIADILAASRRNNARADLTGMLLYIDGGFLQVLEGPDAAVDETYARIRADARHTGAIALWSEQTDTRAFADWTMGYDALPARDERWTGAFRIDPRRPDDALLSGAGPDIMALMRSFYETAGARRFA